MKFLSTCLLRTCTYFSIRYIIFPSKHTRYIQAFNLPPRNGVRNTLQKVVTQWRKHARKLISANVVEGCLRNTVVPFPSDVGMHRIQTVASPGIPGIKYFVSFSSNNRFLNSFRDLEISKIKWNLKSLCMILETCQHVGWTRARHTRTVQPAQFSQYNSQII